MFHTHLILGGFNYPSSLIPHVMNTPVLKHLIGNSPISMSAVNSFWILSGFLCVHQVKKILRMHDNNDNIAVTSKSWYIWYFLNRILRLYPIFILNMMILFLNATPEEMPSCTNTRDLLMGLSTVDVFFKAWDSTGCSGVGWTLCADIHGYLVIMLLFLLFGNKDNPKRYILGSLILFSIIYDIYNAFENNLDHSIQAIDITTFHRTQNPYHKTWQYFIESDKYDELFLQNMVEMDYATKFFNTLYYTSIFSNGSSVFVGALLYLNINKRDTKQALGFIATLFLSACAMVSCYIISLNSFRTDNMVWVAAEEGSHYNYDYNYNHIKGTLLNGLGFHFADLMFYCILYLLMTPNSTIAIQIIQNICQWRVFEFVSKFTFGIYMTHVSVGVVFGHNIDYVNVMLPNPSKYNWIFLVNYTIYVFCVSLIVAIILHIVVEYPVKLFRYKYIRSLYVSNKNAMKKSNKSE